MTFPIDSEDYPARVRRCVAALPGARRPERRDTRRPVGLARSVILPVFVINLDRRPDRWAAISGNLGALGIVPQRIRATDADRVMGAIPDDLSFSQAACRESHFAALDAFLQTGAPAALILEDDAELAPPVCGLLASADWWPAAAHVVKLGGCGEPALLGRPVGRTPCGGEIRPIAQASAVACAYMIDREGAGIATGEAPRVGMTVDSFLFHMVGSPAARRLKPAHVVPALARVRPGQGSDICRDLSPHATGPAMRAVFRAGVWLRRMTGQVRRVPLDPPDRGGTRPG